MRERFLFFISSLMAASSSLSAEGLGPQYAIPIPVDRFINCFVEKEQTEQIVFVAKNIEGSCQIEKIALMFDLFEVVDIPSARLVVLHLVSDFIDEINKQENLKKYFTTFPLKTDNLDIRLRVRPLPGCVPYPKIGNIAYISALDNIIYYGTLNSYTNTIDNLRTETLDQAYYFVSRE